jgi:2-methylcitrate dehydratase PrpD
MVPTAVHPLARPVPDGWIRFALETRYADLPASVTAQARRCLLDLVGVAAAGSRTPAARLARAHAASQMRSSEGGARLLFDGRRASRAGAAFAGATAIDSFDAHDGHALIKGHVGVMILPTLLAYADDGVPLDGRTFLTALALGYELGTRCGIAQHGTAPDYHASGSWGALAVATIAARLRGLDAGTLREAVGVAEYWGPRSQMMRYVTNPTMVKDASGWGAFVGVSALELAADGFTGAPAVVIESPATAFAWDDLGRRWRILEQYFKPYPVCRWTQPAVEAALALRRAHDLAPEAVARIEVASFREAVSLACRRPADTDRAQYSTPWAVAAAVARGRLTADEVMGDALADPEIRRLSDGAQLTISEEFAARFPAERWAEVRLTLVDGRVLVSEPATARGNPDAPLPDHELREKFRALTEPMLGRARAREIETLVDGLPESTSVMPLLDALLSPA